MSDDTTRRVETLEGRVNRLSEAHAGTATLANITANAVKDRASKEQTDSIERVQRENVQHINRLNTEVEIVKQQTERPPWPMSWIEPAVERWLPRARQKTFLRSVKNLGLAVLACLLLYAVWIALATAKRYADSLDFQRSEMQQQTDAQRREADASEDAADALEDMAGEGAEPPRAPEPLIPAPDDVPQ